MYLTLFEPKWRTSPRLLSVVTYCLYVSIVKACLKILLKSKGSNKEGKLK